MTQMMPSGDSIADSITVIFRYTTSMPDNIPPVDTIAYSREEAISYGIP